MLPFSVVRCMIELYLIGVLIKRTREVLMSSAMSSANTAIRKHYFPVSTTHAFKVL